MLANKLAKLSITEELKTPQKQSSTLPQLDFWDASDSGVISSRFTVTPVKLANEEADAGYDGDNSLISDMDPGESQEIDLDEMMQIYGIPDMKEVEFDFVDNSKQSSSSIESSSAGRETLPGTVSALLDHTNCSKKNYGYVNKDANVDFVEKEPEPIFASVSAGHHTPTKNVNHDYVKMEEDPYRPMNDIGILSSPNQLTTPTHPDLAEKIGALMKTCSISDAKNNDSDLVKAKPKSIFASMSSGYQTPLKNLNKDGKKPSKSVTFSLNGQETDSKSDYDFSSTKNPANSSLVPKADHKAARNFGPGTHQFDFKDVNLQAPKKSTFSPKDKSSLRKHHSQNVNSEVASECTPSKVLKRKLENPNNQYVTPTKQKSL